MRDNNPIDPTTGATLSPQAHCEQGAVRYSDEAERDAYERGYNHGHGIACHNVPTIGDRIFSDSLGRVTVDAENIREIHKSECHAAADNSRSYSPFEFTARDFNEAEDSESLWEAFETGTCDAIDRDLTDYSDADYGIDADDLESNDALYTYEITFRVVTDEADTVLRIEADSAENALRIARNKLARMFGADSSAALTSDPVRID